MTGISETYRRYVPRRHLYNIVHMDSVSSILSKGIRSHNSMASCSHKDISLLDVQNRRAEVSFEKLGTKLHDYANLYFDARNPMMYYLKFHREDFPNEYCVLALDYAILDLDGVLVTDSNAAYGLMRYGSPEAMLGSLDFARIFARFWTDDDEIEMAKRKVQKCAEVLVPDAISPSYIRGAYVANETAKELLRKKCPSVKVAVCGDLFFI